MPEVINLMLDSGAFSAWTQGKQINLDEYCDYIKRNQEWIGSYVALDVINPDNPAAAAEASFQNLLHMHKRGLRPIPVFHAGESFDYLLRMLDLGCDYIGLAATSLTARGNIDPWYRDAWSHLTEQSGLPIIKAHALGETRKISLSLFPWASADSTSWIYKAQITGTLVLPGAERILVGVRNDKKDLRNAEDIERMSEANKHAFDAAMVRYGIDPERLKQRDQVATYIRTYLTVLAFKSLEDQTRACHPVTFHQRDNFRGFCSPVASNAEPVDVSPFNLYFVCNATWWSIVIPAYAGVESTLASFFYIQEFPNHFQYLPAYVADPIDFITTHKKASKLYTILEENITL